MAHNIPHSKESRQKISQSMKSRQEKEGQNTEGYKTNIVREYMMKYLQEINTIEEPHIDERGDIKDDECGYCMKDRTLYDLRCRLDNKFTYNDKGL